MPHKGLLGEQLKDRLTGTIRCGGNRDQARSCGRRRKRVIGPLLEPPCTQILGGKWHGLVPVQDPCSENSRSASVDRHALIPLLAPELATIHVLKPDCEKSLQSLGLHLLQGLAGCALPRELGRQFANG